MNVATGFDSAWDWPSAAALRAWVKAHGPNPVVSGYLGPDSTKNWTPARLKQVHGLGAGAEMNFEWYSNRALEGYNAGVTDGRMAGAQVRALAKAVGYSAGTRIIVTFSVDFDTNPGQYPAIDAYLRGAQAGLGGLADAGDYGEYDLVMHTAKVGTSHAEWQTYAWSQGQFAAGIADFYQWQNSMTLGGASVDFDQVIDAAKLGAWWPPSHPLNKPTPSPKPVPAPTPVPVVEDQMILVSVDTATVPTGTAHPGVFTFDAGVLSHVEAPTGKVNNLANLEKKLGAPVHISYSQYKKWGGK